MTMTATRARGYHGRLLAEFPERRFWSRVDKSGDCWLWLGGYSGNGYGRFSPKRDKGVGAHRFAYESVVGPIPSGKEIDHLCRNRGCVNPAHLEVVTSKQNLLRGEGACAQNARKTHCPQGHPYDFANTLIKIDRKGRRGRACRACHRTRSRQRQARLRREQI